MKTLIKTSISIVIALGWLFSVNAFAAEVAQGECVSYNQETKIVTIQEYDTDFSKSKYGNPTGIISEFDVSTAKIGMLPEPGNILRISYMIEGNKKAALKIMNVSKQDLMKK